MNQSKPLPEALSLDPQNHLGLFLLLHMSCPWAVAQPRTNPHVANMPPQVLIQLNLLIGHPKLVARMESLQSCGVSLLDLMFIQKAIVVF